MIDRDAPRHNDWRDRDRNDRNDRNINNVPPSPSSSSSLPPTSSSSIEWQLRDVRDIRDLQRTVQAAVADKQRLAAAAAVGAASPSMVPELRAWDNNSRILTLCLMPYDFSMTILLFFSSLFFFRSHRLWWCITNIITAYG
jgi:hypothetical protein